MERSRDTTGKEQLASEKVHLDLAALLAAIIDDPIDSHRRRFGRASWIDCWHRAAVRIVAKFNVTDFVRHEESLLERRAHVLVKDQLIGGDEGCAPAVEHSRPNGRRFDVDPASLGFGDSKVIGRPGIGPGCSTA